MSVIVFLAITNCLIATTVGIVFTFILKMKTFGGYWVAWILALVGSFIGTLIGIRLESKHLVTDGLVFQGLIPLACSAALVFVYLAVSLWHSDE